MNFVVLAAIGCGADATGNGVSWLPIGREVGTSAVADGGVLLRVQ